MRQLFSRADKTPRGASASPHGRPGISILAAAALVLFFGASAVSAQQAQDGTKSPSQAVPGQDGLRAEKPPQGDLEMVPGEDEDEESAEGCPYLGTPLELIV